MDAPAMVEAVLDRGKSSGTHKFLVLAALMDAIIECPEQDPRGGMHRIPVMELARRVLALVWKPVLRGIAQSSGKSGGGGKLDNVVRNLDNEAPVWPDQGPSSSGQIAWGTDTAGAQLFHELPSGGPIPPAVRRALTDVWRNVLEYPLQRIPRVEGGEKRRLDLYHIVTLLDDETTGAFFERSADENIAVALNRGIGSFRQLDRWDEFVAADRCWMVLSARTWEELSEVRFWIRDAITLRWIRECQKLNAHRAVVLDDLMMPSAIGRDPGAVSAIKRIYEERGLLRCPWTGQKLHKHDYVLDHVLPFSRFPVNLYWNLVPTTSDTNSNKRARIPDLSGHAGIRYREHLSHCLLLATSEPLFEAQTERTWRNYFQLERVVDRERSAQTLFAMVDRTAGRLARPGIEDRWVAC